MGSPPSERYNAAYVRIYCTGKLYNLNQQLEFSFKKKQIPNEQLYRARVECASQWQRIWLCVETAINMKFYNMNEVLYDKWTQVR
jgi:hypothetical protein